MGDRMRYWFEKKSANIITFILLGKYMYTYRRAIKEPLYWKKKQEKEIKKFVRYIYNIPFYRERFEEAGLTPEDIRCGDDFLKFPILTKKEYKQWMDDEYNRTPKKYKHWKKNKTSGSSGTPMLILQRPIDNSSDIANFFRGVLIQNKKYRLFFDKTFNITSKEKSRKGGNSILQHIGIVPRRVFGGSVPEFEIIEEFNRFKPDIIHGAVSALVRIADYAEENGIRLHLPKLVCTLGEKMDEKSRTILERAWPETIYNLYGSTESGNMAVNYCNNSQGDGNYTVWHDTHILNVVDKKDNPSMEGRLLITSLGHKGFPIVNYDIGDLVEMYEDRCIKKIKKIVGRDNDLLYNVDGSYYNHQTVQKITDGISEILQFQIVQETYDLIFFYLVVNQTEKKDDIEKTIRENAKRFLYKGEKEIRVIFLDRIPADKSGKRRLLISKVNQSKFA